VPGFISKLKRRLIPRDAHSSTRLWLVGPWEDKPSELVSEFTRDPVLVLAPHPDDEIIGPGGTLRRHILAGAPVTIVILTDGKWGGYNPDGKLVEKRKDESRNAAKILGAPEPIFLNAPDGDLGNTPEAATKLERIIADTNPKYIYLPALTDGHPDHWSTNQHLYTLLPKLRGDAVIRGYEVWTPALANICIDITEIAEIKKQAIEAFPTQTAQHDYTAAALGLNRYRSLQHLKGRGYAEAFTQMTAQEFDHLFRSASLRHLEKTPLRTRD
jgi:LmbE family N-acetylglucosaminyl deacetylase